MPQTKPIPSRKGSSLTPDVHAKPKKTARFSVPNLRATSWADENNACGTRLKKSQTTLTQIDFVKSKRRLSEQEFDFIDEAQSPRVPGRTVHHDNSAVPDEGVSRCKGRRITPGRGVKRGLSAISGKDTEEDDTLTQMGFVKSSFRGLQDHDYEDDGLDANNHLRREAKTNGVSQNRQGSSFANDELGRCSRREPTEESSKIPDVPSQGGSGLHIRDQPEATQQSVLFVTPQKSRDKGSPESSMGDSPQIAETPERMIEEESPTKRRSTRVRRLLLSRTEPREQSLSPSVQSDVLRSQLDAALPVCYSSVDPTQSSFDGEGKERDDELSHTPDTSPNTADVDYEDAPMKKGQYTTNGIATRSVQATCGSPPKDSRCISNSQGENWKGLLRSLIDETDCSRPQFKSPIRQHNSLAFKKEQLSQTQSVRIPPSVLEQASDDDPMTKSQSEIQRQSLALQDYLQNIREVADNSLESSILYARRHYEAPFEPLSSDLREIDSEQVRQLFPSSSEHSLMHQMVRLSEIDQEEIPTQSQSYLGSSRSGIIGGSNRDPFLGRDQELASTEVVPDSSDAVCSQHSSSMEHLSQTRPEESFPSSPPATFVRSSQPNEKAESGREERNHEGDEEETPTQKEYGNADTTAQRDIPPNKPLRLIQLLPSSLMTWPKPLFEIDGLVWNGETHVRLSQLPEDEGARLLEKGRHRK
ncbi:hypothetical protein KEM54_005082 [Ascosphaera aggregata]|nr:hypothetical protein KEM54_005082 [Ascosphaera aggregata]